MGCASCPLWTSTDVMKAIDRTKSLKAGRKVLMEFGYTDEHEMRSILEPPNDEAAARTLQQAAGGLLDLLLAFLQGLLILDWAVVVRTEYSNWDTSQAASRTLQQASAFLLASLILYWAVVINLINYATWRTFILATGISFLLLPFLFGKGIIF